MIKVIIQACHLMLHARHYTFQFARRFFLQNLHVSTHFQLNSIYSIVSLNKVDTSAYSVLTLTSAIITKSVVLSDSSRSMWCFTRDSNFSRSASCCIFNALTALRTSSAPNLFLASRFATWLLTAASTLRRSNEYCDWLCSRRLSSSPIYNTKLYHIHLRLQCKVGALDTFFYAVCLL